MTEKLSADKYDFDKPRFSIQWHLTNDCGNRCRHCYMTRSGKALSFEDCRLIINDFSRLVKHWNANPRIYLTGGDPLLCSYFYNLFEYILKKLGEKVKIGILGNPETLTEYHLKRLVELKPFFYQLSIDGLEEKHDFIRYRGSFKQTVKAIGSLQSAGIKVAVMCTVSNVNIDDLLPVIDLVASKKIRFFDFARFSPPDHHNLGENRKTIISPLKYREVMFEVLAKYEHYRSDSGCVTLFGEKDPLWALVNLERGRLNKIRRKSHQDLVVGGCNIGANALSILHDGIVLGCRRIAKPIGKVPQQSLRSIFIRSKNLNYMRRISAIEKCCKCELLVYCRGCRAVAYGYTGNFFAPDPQCWKS